MQDKDKNFVDDEQRAGVDANYYAKETYDYYKILSAENHMIIKVAQLFQSHM